jgi:hypothetical protein
MSALDRVPGWVTVVWLIGVATLAVLACDAPQTWTYR